MTIAGMGAIRKADWPSSQLEKRRAVNVFWISFGFLGLVTMTVISNSRQEVVGLEAKGMHERLSNARSLCLWSTRRDVEYCIKCSWSMDYVILFEVEDFLSRTEIVKE